MTKQELIEIGKDKVRGDKNLMLIYIQMFKKQFGYEPDCISCHFNSDWQKFTRTNTKKIITVKNNIMNENKYEVKGPFRNSILTYYEDGIPRRLYGNAITDEFAKKYLSVGTPEELEERKKQFKKIPEENKKEIKAEKIKSVTNKKEA